MKKINLRNWANSDLVAVLDDTTRRYRCEVEDDNGDKVITDSWLLALTWFSLGIHRYFDNYPYLINEVVVLKPEENRQAFIDDGLLTKPIDNFLQRIMIDMNDPDGYDLIKQLIFVWHNQIHNYMCVKSETGVVAGSTYDINHAYKNPKIANLKQRVNKGETNLGDAMIEFEQIMMTDPDFDRSVFGLLYRTRAVSSVQSFQLIIARGYVTDLDSSILPNAVLNSYGDGITNLADSLADSKGAGFSLISNGAALQDSEWFHKKVHNLAQVVQGITYQTDCGSTKGPKIKVVSKDFKKSLAGKWRILEDGTTELLHGENLNKINTGEFIKIRSVAWCNHGRTGKPCSKCFGKMESAIPYNPYTKRGAVPGLFYGSTFAEPIGQSILKTKHRIGTASSVGYKINPRDADYIKTDEQGDFIYFNEKILNNESEPYLILDKETQQDFSDYSFMESLDELDGNRLRTYEKIQLKVSVANPMFPDVRATHYPIIVTTVASRDARMTKAFVEYLMSQPIENEGKTYKISLKNFSSNEPAFELPEVNEDLDAYRKRVESFFLFKELRRRWDYYITEEIHGELLVSLWKVVDEKYKNANIILHDIFLFSCMARDPTNLNYGLPGADDQRVILSLHEAVIHRGMCNALLYGYQNESLLKDPYKFLIQNRQGGALEAFMQTLAN